MEKIVYEWLTQAQYDLESADAMRKSGRNVYAVLMCHMAVEKAFGFHKIQYTGNP